MYKIIDNPFESIKDKKYVSRIAAANDFTYHHDIEEYKKASSVLGKAYLTIILPITYPLAVLDNMKNLKFQKLENKIK